MGRNGSSKVLKTDGVTLTWYGGTQTLLLQGGASQVGKHKGIFIQCGLLVKKKRNTHGNQDSRYPSQKVKIIPDWKQALHTEIEALFSKDINDFQKFKEELTGLMEGRSRNTQPEEKVERDMN